MISDERMRELIGDSSLDWHEGYGFDSEDNRYLQLARAIKREAIAEPVRLMKDFLATVVFDPDKDHAITAMVRYPERMK